MPSTLGRLDDQRKKTLGISRIERTKSGDAVGRREVPGVFRQPDIGVAAPHAAIPLCSIKRCAVEIRRRQGNCGRLWAGRMSRWHRRYSARPDTGGMQVPQQKERNQDHCACRDGHGTRPRSKRECLRLHRRTPCFAGAPCPNQPAVQLRLCFHFELRPAEMMPVHSRLLNCTAARDEANWFLKSHL